MAILVSEHSFAARISKFEEKIGGMLELELLEKLDSPYQFGSGYAVYRSTGIVFRITYDGKDGMVVIERAGKHEHYPDCSWETIYTGYGELLTREGLEAVLDSFKH